MITPYISSLVMIFGGGYLALLGFKIINPKKDNPEQQERMIKWHEKFGKFAKYIGVTLVIFGFIEIIFTSLNPYFTENTKANNGWTIEQKEQLTIQIINNSDFLKSINPDTAKLVSECFVEKYSAMFTFEDLQKQDKLPQEQVIQISMPMIKDCLRQYGLKTID